MRYLVVLDARSPIGDTYANGTHDGMTNGNPVLDCESIDNSSPQYMICSRDSKSHDVHQTVHVPHYAVAYVLEYAKGQARPIGFGPPAFA